MTISTTVNQVAYAGDGVSLAFPFPYPFITTNDLKVFLNGSQVTTGFSVSGVSLAGGSGTFSSGTVTFVVAPGVSVPVLIYCDPDLLQSTSLPPNDPFPSKTVEKMIDKITLLVQRIYQKFGNAITFPPSDTTSGLLPDAAGRANKILAFDALGAPLVSIPASGSATALALLLADSVSASNGVNLTAYNPALAYGSGLGAFLNTTFARTALEISAGVTPSNYAYPPGSVFRYGAVGSGVVDDAPALQRWVNSGGSHLPGPAFTFALASKVVISIAQTVIEGHGSKIKQLASYSSGGSNTLVALQVAASNVEITGVHFDGAGSVTQTVYNAFIACVAGFGNTIVHGCRFANLVTGAGAQAAVMFLSGTFDGRAHHNIFDTCPGAVFTQAPGTRIDNNVAREPSDVSFALNGVACVGANVNNNYVFNTNTSCSAHIAAEEGASEWVITGNYLRGVKDGTGISALNVAVFTVVRGGIIANNFVDGGSLVTTSPCAGISWTANYTNVDCHDNVVRRMPSGNANTRGAIIASTNSKFHDNEIDCGGSAFSAVISIVIGGLALDITNNKVTATGNSRAYLFGAGNNASNRVAFFGGEIIGGTNGIDADLAAPTNVDLWIINHGNLTSTTPLVVAVGIAAFADWQTYFNAGAKSYPHSIKTMDRTIMYGNSAPAAGSGFPGGYVYRQTPALGSPLGWTKVAGTWQPLANL